MSLQLQPANPPTGIPLSLFPLPLQPFNPPAGYGWEERDSSTPSATTTFDTGLDQRDTFLGRRRCIICGEDIAVNRCHIIMESQPDVVSQKASELR
jgi:hypothetical protein